MRHNLIRFNFCLKLEKLKEFKEAEEFFKLGKYRLSNEFYNRSLFIIKNNNLQNTMTHVNILKKLAYNQIKLKRNSKCEEYLESIIKIIQNDIIEDQEQRLFKEYNNLLIHCNQTNINKAIILSKALLSTQLNDKNKCLVLYHQGTANLLKGNFETAKEKLRQSLQLSEDNELKGFIYNNLAVACWWHRYPNSRELESSDEDETNLYSSEQIDQDYQQSINYFKDSITAIEGENLELLNKKSIIPIDYVNYDPNINLCLKNKKSGIPLMNLSEYILNTKPELKNEATFWFKYVLKFYQKYNPQNIDRTLITLAQLCAQSQEIQKAEGLFQKALLMLQNQESYNKILALQLYGNMLQKIPNRQKEGEKLLSQSFELEEKLPFWSNRIIHILIPEFQLE